jgi:hypothetical protein
LKPHATSRVLARAQAAAQEAVALLREQLRLREGELATLRAARPGACSRCAEVALALASHPTFRPRTGAAAEWEAWDARLAARATGGGGGGASAAAELRNGGRGGLGGGARHGSGASLSGGASGGGGSAGVAAAPHTAGAALRALAAAPPRLAAAAAAGWVWLTLLDAAALPLLAAFAAALLQPNSERACPGAHATLLLSGVLATAAALLALALRSARLAAALAAYAAWIALADGAPRRGGRPLRALRSARLWRALASARRMSLHKTGDLEPAGRYVVACGPAGHVSAAALLAFAAPRAAGWASLFPGLDARLAAPPGGGAFGVPLLREGLLGLGVCDGSDAGLLGALHAASDGGAGIALVVPIPMPGGPAAAGAPPPPHDAAAGARRRVARAALRAGASIVPAYAFGDAHESELPPSHAAPLRRLLGVAFPGVPGALGPAAAALATALAPRLPPSAAAALRRAAASLTLTTQQAAAQRGVRVVLGHPFACPLVAHPTEALVDDVAARLWRETAALAAAHASPEDETPTRAA